MLESLTPAQWDAPTLCAGWRVREVAAHMSFRRAATSTGWRIGGPARTRPHCPRPSRSAPSATTPTIPGDLRSVASRPRAPVSTGPSGPGQ
nr:maleylpyruvate isomerase N-terminal domain-containing protein [Nonomuraea wenchangensis]